MRRRSFTLWLAGAGVAVLGGGALIGVGLLQGAVSQPGQVATAERVSIVSQTDTLVDASAAAPHAMSIPALGFAAEVLPLARDGAAVLDPPGATAAYWLSDYGFPGEGSEDTVYLIGHSSDAGTAVFDAIVNPATQSTPLLAGDEIVLETETGSVLYEVVTAERQDRTALADLERVWSSAPGRLVIITCLFDEARNAATDNMIVYARQRG